MKSSIKRVVGGGSVLVVLVAVLVLSGCEEALDAPQEPTPPGDDRPTPSPSPEKPIPFNPPSPPGPSVSGTAAGTLRIQGAMIVSAGQVHEGSAPTADAGLMGVKVNGHVYLYHPDLGDVQLSEETSDLAVQYAIYGGAPESPAATLQVASATEPKPGNRYRKTKTGMRVRISTASPSDHYTFENTTVLWHTVVSRAEAQPTFFAPKSILGMDWRNFEFYLERREEREVQVDGWDVELYRDLLRGSFSAATLVATPLSIGRYRAAVAAGADPQVFVKMVPIVITEEIAKVIDQLLDQLPLDQCLDIIVDPLLDVAESHLIAMFTNENHRIVSFSDALIQSFPANATLCAARVLAASASGGASELFIEAVEKVMLLKWAANEVLVGYDSIAYDAYATVPGLPQPIRWTAAVDDRTYTAGTPITTLTLPEASGGSPPLTYSLTPTVPGLTFSAVTRTLRGTPTSADTYRMTYTTADRAGGSASLRFNVTVQAASLPPENVGRKFRDCADCPLMVEAPSGTYVMGSPATESGRYSDEGPQHQVTIGYRLAAGVYEVTFAEWDACVAAGGCNGHVPADWGWGRGTRPVIGVNWFDAQNYLQWLSGKTGKRYRLLSEAEWEYVARAGTTTPYHTGSTISRDQANYDFRTVGSTVPVGSYPANAFGLHDVHGNVWEWTQDCWNDGYRGAPADGSAWEAGFCDRRVNRGGSLYNFPRYLRSAYRSWETAGERDDDVGFRVARTLDS